MTRINHLSASLFLFLILSVSAKSQTPTRARAGDKSHSTFQNFNSRGQQIVRFDNMGEAVDAHDGEIAFFDGVYYLYGTSYGCGFEWGRKDAPFCGFKVYSSTDMVTWTDRGFLFDATTPVWQSRCNGNTYGCFRPHVVYNKKTGLYVLWINVYDNQVGFRVFTSSSPTGPFKEVAEPRLAVNSEAPVAGLNNGDHDTFVDEDGTGYIAYTDWRTKGTIVIEELTGDYLSGTGKHVKSVTAGKTEAPALFKRKGLYYVTYSDPNCGYCSGTGTSYKTAKSPLGPWSEGIRISNNSCGGQPSFVSPIELATGTIYLYCSDLWNNAAKNEALANFYWAPLVFNEDGSIQPMACQEKVSQPFETRAKRSKRSITPAGSSGNAGFTWFSDIGGDLRRSQSFRAEKNGLLTDAAMTTFRTGYPEAALQVQLFRADASGLPTGQALFSATVAADSVSWAPHQIRVAPRINVVKGQAYALVLGSAAKSGKYGFAFNDDQPYQRGVAAISTDKGKSFKAEPGRSLKFYTRIR
ncbi:hypothetical protein C7T94_13945 [Pedobacter yulinensis]|uniref:Glycosyl hydrolase family 43 n=1 Tax=Pedobacter yulinensis TaxID=2126353 RepID=A0A2T3HMH2_9SPHI|nr:family 43 glycosylhydrolase [Pedobacter yulinensis]PST83634.1 hypothetical protein C7T94_13945 [Pedobacter yulinensis]